MDGKKKPKEADMDKLVKGWSAPCKHPKRKPKPEGTP